MISLKRWHYSVFFFIFSVIITPFINYFLQDQFKLETSVWCFKSSKQTNLCKFKNICYDPEFKAFLFFVSEDSVIRGLDHYSKLQKIQLSSVQQHNQFFANLSVIDIKNFKLLKELKIHSKALLLSRFKPNNLMHIIHDDLFPMYLTLESVCLGDRQCIESYGLVFHDGHPIGPFFHLYELFSKNPPIILNELKLDSNFLLCFKEILTGLVQDSVVYQYGFKKSHGPIKPIKLTQKDISRFTLFIKNKLKVLNEIIGTREIVLINRQKNRKILNIKEVKKMIKNVYEKMDQKIYLKQINLNLFSYDFKSLLKIISRADGLIGMHGAEMILSLFLKPNSFVFELFPFGINPEVVSFIKPISEVKGCNFIYFSWKNMLKNNSIAHSDAPSLFGGITHLDEMTQMNIKNALEVPPVECCNNPLFLYHMYQDTLISDDFERFFYKSLSKTFTHQSYSVGPEILKEWFYPYTVSNVSCVFQRQRDFLEINWNPPFNVKNFKKLIYSLFIKSKRGSFSKNVLLEKTTVLIEIPPGVEPVFDVWISAYFRNSNSKSPDLYMHCY